MSRITPRIPTLLSAALLLCVSCGRTEETTVAPAKTPTKAQPAKTHSHGERPMGSIQMENLTVGLMQGHGGLKAGATSHLQVKLPYTDGGATTVHAWLGGPQRPRASAGKGEFDAGRGVYDVHANAPAVITADTKWWIEVQRPDGTKVTGSATPLFD